MSFKINILKRYLHNDKIHVVIGHDSWKYFGLISKNIFYLILLFGLYGLLLRFLNENIILSIIFGLVGLFVYFKFVIDFFDIYLDSLVLTHAGIVLFKWEGLFENKSELLNRESLEAVQDSQNGIADIILNKGNINLKRNDEDYVFDNITNPTKYASMILNFQEKFLNSRQEQEQPEFDKFDILVETLGEVIVDYIKKDHGKKLQNNHTNDDNS